MLILQHLSFLLPKLSSEGFHAPFDILNLKGSQLSPEIRQTNFASVDCFANYRVSIFFKGHVLNFGNKNLVHSGIGVSVGEFEEIVTVKFGDFLTRPLIFKFV